MFARFYRAVKGYCRGNYSYTCYKFQRKNIFDYIKMCLSENQKDIVNTSGNLIVRASAGTGKTHTMVAKIEKEIDDNHSHKLIAAITFTIKAAKEIHKRLKIDVSEHFIGTNNRFAIEEIIQPFFRDVFGYKYKCDNISTDYSLKEETFEGCLNNVKQKNIICSYKDNKKNFVFELALRIVKRSKACQLFLKAKYFKIYVDEYQDCDSAMHDFFIYLCNDLNINLFVVGDNKQSIYMWRGAYPEAFKSILSMGNFKKGYLTENYRSCQMIQNYSNLLDNATKHLYKPESDKNHIFFIKTESSQWIEKLKPYIDIEKTCALIRFYNKDAECGAKELSNIGTKFIYVPRPPISEITTAESWLYNAIAKYFIVEKYSEYDFIDEIPEESIGDKKIYEYIKLKLESIGKSIDNKENKKVICNVREIASYFGYSIAYDKNIEDMIKTITDKKFHPAFNMEEIKHISITIHSSKGLEYDQVIVFAHDYPLDKEESIYNHYVAVTRAKTKLLIIYLKDKKGSKEYCKNLKQIFDKISPYDVLNVV